MGVLKKEELMSAVQNIIGDRSDDEALNFIADITDTVNYLENNFNDADSWKSKYEENDKAWREKYRDRFFTGDNTEETPSYNDGELQEDITIDDLFKKE